MTTEPSSATNVDQLHDSFEENLTSFGVQYGYLIPVSERVIPLPMGIDERAAKSALLMYNATLRLRGRHNAATLVERIVTRWEPPEAPQPSKAAQARLAKVEQLTVDNNPLGSGALNQPAE